MSFKHSFRVYIPSTVGVNNAVDNAGAVAGCLSFLSSRFGGATAIDASGAWVSESAGLVLEKGTICYAFTNLRGLLSGRRAVLDYAKKVRDEMKQEAVSVEIDGRLYLV